MEEVSGDQMALDHEIGGGRGSGACDRLTSGFTSLALGHYCCCCCCQDNLEPPLSERFPDFGYHFLL